MKSSIIAAAVVLLGAGISYAGGCALGSLKSYSSAELNIPQVQAAAVVSKAVQYPLQTGDPLPQEEPVSISVIKASSVSGKIEDGSSVRRAATCQVTRYEYKDRIGLLLQSDAYTYAFPFTVKKVFLPLDHKIVLGDNNELDSYIFKPSLFGKNGHLVTKLERFYSNSTFTPYSHEAKLEVSQDLSQVLSASVDLDDPYGADGDFSCDFSGSHFEAL